MEGIREIQKNISEKRAVELDFLVKEPFIHDSGSLGTPEDAEVPSEHEGFGKAAEVISRF
jgi:hypothetical protein